MRANVPVATKAQFIQLAVITGLSLNVHFNGAEAELTGIDGGFESGHYDRIKF